MCSLSDFLCSLPGAETSEKLKSGQQIKIRLNRADEEEPAYVVVLAPGNPSEQFGSSHAAAPLVLALEKAVSELGVPTVRLDYPGVGMNTMGGPTDDASKWAVPGDDAARASVREVVDWARETICKRVVLMGYSYGASHCLIESLESKEGVYANVMVSFGYKVFMFFPEPLSSHIQKEQERHAEIAVPTLYLCGEMDRMTPQNELKRLIDSRPDGGAGATIEIIQKGKHDFKGQEREAAQAMKPWLQRLSDSVVRDSAIAGG